ncbi:MAG: phage holin family protein [Solirubrobacterales bacterium]
MDDPGTPPSGPPHHEPLDPGRRTVGELFLDVSEKTTFIVREEIELAKAEVSEKVSKLLRGSAVAAAAGTFAFMALILFLFGVAYLISDLLFDSIWPGFFIEAAILLVVAAIAGLIAYRAIQAGSPPVPAQAIEDAKQTRAVLEHAEPEVPDLPPIEQKVGR